MFKLNIVIIVLFLYATQGAVIRTTEIIIKNETLENTTVVIDNKITTLEPVLKTIPKDDSSMERNNALSRDEQATILIVDKTLLNPAPADLIRAEVGVVEIEKSGKLLLLSTPKITEKPKQPEENFEQSVEEESETIDNVTETFIETTTVDEETTTNISVDEEKQQNQSDDMDEIKTENVMQVEKNHSKNLPSIEKITKLYPINDTLYADIKNKEISDTIVVDKTPKETLNSNLNSVILEESEADYILVESEALEGSYTDVDSELHLQPIVQSVEIVPSSLDDTLLINYV
ncbi:uncharacterized protein ACRADG_002315 [Cochliomyia hominivorax]